MRFLIWNDECLNEKGFVLILKKIYSLEN
jgi:hypothetical protein